MHVFLVEVAKSIFWVKPQEIVWSDLHTSISQHLVARYSLYGKSQTCYVQKVSCLSSLTGCGISMQLIL